MFTRYGKCYTFNDMTWRDEYLKTTKGGIDNGLELILDSQQDEYMPVWQETGSSCLYKFEHVCERVCVCVCECVWV